MSQSQTIEVHSSWSSCYLNKVQQESKIYSNMAATTLGIRENDLEDDDLRLKIYYSGLITVIYLRCDQVIKNQHHERVNLETVRIKVREICGFDTKSQQPFTIKWIDDEGDPCTISSQDE